MISCPKPICRHPLDFTVTITLIFLFYHKKCEHAKHCCTFYLHIQVCSSVLPFLILWPISLKTTLLYKLIVLVFNQVMICVNHLWKTVTLVSKGVMLNNPEIKRTPFGWYHFLVICYRKILTIISSVAKFLEN